MAHGERRQKTSHEIIERDARECGRCVQDRRIHICLRFVSNRVLASNATGCEREEHVVWVVTTLPVPADILGIELRWFEVP